MTTPYQGKKRCFGEFKCTNCFKVWKSANSHANQYQECRNCYAKVFPLSQKPLQSLFENLRKNKTHKFSVLKLESTLISSESSASTNSTTDQSNSNQQQ